MSSIVSRSPSRRNQSKDSRWMSIRLGRSRTCLRREKDLRARGAVTVLAKKNSLPYWLWNEGRSRRKGQESVQTAGGVRTRRRTPYVTEGDPPAATHAARVGWPTREYGSTRAAAASTRSWSRV